MTDLTGPAPDENPATIIETPRIRPRTKCGITLETEQVYGVLWATIDLPEPVSMSEIQWFSDYEEARRAYEFACRYCWYPPRFLAATINIYAVEKPIGKTDER